MRKEIPLVEALTGIDFEIEHLDGSKFRVQAESGQVIKPDQIMCIPEKGMPFHNNSFKFGNLFILFKLIFPERLESIQITPVKNCLESLD